MEVITIARTLRALSVRHSNVQPKRFVVSASLGAFLALLAITPFAMSDAQATTAVGAIAGTASVNSTGAAIYTIPITLPPGTNGMQPSLALVYNSQSGNGWAGYGWTLTGLSAITRCASNPEDDGAAKGNKYNIPVQYSTTSSYSDDFCLDGQKLMLVSGSYYGANGATYGKEIEDFSVITSYTTGSSGPTYFTVKTKDGRIYEYGNTSDSSIVATNKTVVRTWALDKVTDANGNYMTYQYGSTSLAGLEYWPTAISYTGNGSTVPDHQIQFDFEAKSAMVMGHYTSGSLSQVSKRLKDIKVVYGGATTFAYNLSYSLDGGGGRDLLNSVQECGNDGSCLPATTIAWNPSAAGWQGRHSTGITVVNLGRAQSSKLMDVDGDGIDDLVFPGSTWFVAFGQPGGGFGTPVNTGIAVATPITYFGNALAIDYNGDGCKDLVVPTSSGTWTVMISNCTQTGTLFSTTPDNNNIPAFTSNNSQTGTPIFEGNLSVGSFRGNGITDLFDNNGANLQLRRNFAPPSDGSFSGIINLISITGQNIKAPGFVDTGLDFDGSGRAGDLAYLTSGSWAAYVPSGDSSVTLMDTQPGSTTPAMPIDVNGDGLTDLLSNSAANQWQITLSTGSSFKNLLYNLYNDFPDADPIIGDYYGNGTQVAVVDTNSGWYILDPTPDGAGHNNVSDISLSAGIYPYNANFGTGTLKVGSITSYGQSDLVYALNNGDNTFTFYYQLHKFTAGSYPDLVNTITDGLGNVAQFSYNSLSDGGPTYSSGTPYVYPIHAFQRPIPVVAKYTTTDSRGDTYNLTYTYANGAVDVDGHGFLGFASRAVTDSRNGNVETFSYDQTFPYTGLVTEDLLQKSTGDKITDTVTAGPDLISLAAGPDGSQRYYPYFDSSITTHYDFVGGVVQPVSTSGLGLATGVFDSYGNLTIFAHGFKDLTQPGSPQYSRSTSFQYAPPGTGYCAGLPTQITQWQQVPTVSGVTFPDPARRITTASQDTTLCQTNSQTLASGQTGDGTPPLTTTYASRDAFGNITEADVGTGTATRKTLYDFTGGNHEFATATISVVSGSLSLVSHATWNYALGLQAIATDPNGNPTTTTYDGYGRVTSITNPDGSGTASSYGSCPGAGSTYCPAGAAYEVTKSSFNNLSGTSKVTIITGYTAYDSWGRAIEQGTVLLGGGMSRVDTTYDTFGNVTRVTKPFLGASASYATTYTYDPAMDRPLSIGTPQDHNDTCTPCGNITTFSYSGLTVTATQTVGNSASTSTHVSQRRYDPMGDVLSAVDPNGGTTTYSYDAFGDLVAIRDADNLLTTYSYDGLGHKTGMADPNMGTWSYQVDALGEITCQTDAKKQSIVTAYDGVGRVTSKTETSPQAGADCTPAPADVVYTGTWSYDTAAHGLGLPASVSDGNGFARGYDYDSVSRPLDVVTTPGSGAASYTTTTGYDSFGRISTTTYPSTITGVSRFGVTYNYDSASGALSSISDSATSFVYWQVASGGGSAPVDAFGHILGAIDGNSVSTVTAYDQATGAVIGIGTGTSGSSAVQQLAYSWDGFGSLKQRCDANRGLIENFTYDGLNRISTSNVYSGGTAGTCTASTAGAAMALTYDAVGNIQTRSNTGITVGVGTQNDTYTYGDLSHPYAVTGVTSISGSYAYDANGNMVSGNGRTISWNDDNLPTYISSVGTVVANNAVTGSSSFSYSPDLRRYQQVATDSVAGNSTTLYAGKYFEVFTTSSATLYRHRIFANGQVVAVHTIDQGGSPSTKYMHSDHLGSIDVITDDSGAVAQQMSFDAFGLRRDANDWAYDLTGIQVAGLKGSTDRGYTHQEQLDSIGLIHYNARLYDPGLGRFISADNIIPDTSNSQAFDRYTYVYNNPLAFVDKDGHDPTVHSGPSENEGGTQTVTTGPNGGTIYSGFSWDESTWTFIDGTYTTQISDYASYTFTDANGNMIINDVHFTGTVDTDGPPDTSSSSSDSGSSSSSSSGSGSSGASLDVDEDQGDPDPDADDLINRQVQPWLF